MSKDFQLHPDLASTFAWQVDSLYFLLVALSVLFSVGIFVVLVLFAVGLVLLRRVDEAEGIRAAARETSTETVD